MPSIFYDLNSQLKFIFPLLSQIDPYCPILNGQALY
jgi:hypothetical protein